LFTFVLKLKRSKSIIIVLFNNDFAKSMPLSRHKCCQCQLSAVNQLFKVKKKSLLPKETGFNNPKTIIMKKLN